LESEFAVPPSEDVIDVGAIGEGRYGRRDHP
jgi:hypothetical protein